MESIVILDMEAGIFYGTLRDCSHGSSMYVMEGDPMAESLSLLYALLGQQRAGVSKTRRKNRLQKALKAAAMYEGTEEQSADTEMDKDEGRRNNLDDPETGPQKKKQAQEKLYKALYEIIE